MWSISASVSRTPAIGGERTPSTDGAASASSCSRRSGEALTRNHGPSAPRIASDDCVRGTRASACARGLAHLAMAIPLREPPARSRTENPNAHVASSAARGHDASQSSYRWNTYDVTSEHSSTISNLGFTQVIFASNLSV